MAGGNPFVGGKGLFTSSDPMSALRAQPPPTWAAVMPQYMTPQVAAAYKAAGVALVIWEPEASQAGVNAVNQYGAAGYIAQAEGPTQLAAAESVGAQIGVPKALVTNNFMSQYPPGWIAMPEAYQNNNPNATPDQVTRDAKARGAQTVVPVIGLGFVDTPDGRHMSAADYQAGLDAASGAGASGSAAYIADQASTEDLNAYTSGKTPNAAAPPDTGAQPAPQPAPPPPPGSGPVPPPPNPNAPAPPVGPAGAQRPAVPIGPAGAGRPVIPLSVAQAGGQRPVPAPSPGQQLQDGPLGENWNLGWGNQPPTPSVDLPATPYPIPTHVLPHPNLTGPQNPTLPPTLPPPALTPSLPPPSPLAPAPPPQPMAPRQQSVQNLPYLTAPAILKFLNIPQAQPPPPPYHYGY